MNESLKKITVEGIHGPTATITQAYNSDVGRYTNHWKSTYQFSQNGRKSHTTEFDWNDSTKRWIKVQRITHYLSYDMSQEWDHQTNT